MPRKGKKVNKTSTAGLSIERVAAENREASDIVGEPPLGEAYLAQMSTEVADWTGSAAKRYASLAKYTVTLEDMNRRLESRTDRSLKLAEVMYDYIGSYSLCRS